MNNNFFSLILQLEDAEFAKTAAVKVRQNLELELSDVQQQLDDVLRGKADTEDRLMRMSREKADLVKIIGHLNAVQVLLCQNKAIRQLCRNTK
jgi:hypothetical protein